MSPLRRARGFTLIELLIVVTMIGIMIALAVPSFGSFISNYRATSSINEILQGVTLTRAEALKRGRKVSMVPVGGDWRNGWTIFVDKNANGVYDVATDELIFQHGITPASISVAGAGGGNPFSGYNYVAFDGTGYPRVVAPSSPSGGVLTGGIVLTDALGSIRNYRTLCLATLGRPRIVNAVDACSTG